MKPKKLENSNYQIKYLSQVLESYTNNSNISALLRDVKEYFIDTNLNTIRSGRAFIFISISDKDLNFKFHGKCRLYVVSLLLNADMFMLRRFLKKHYDYMYKLGDNIIEVSRLDNYNMLYKDITDEVVKYFNFSGGENA